tara:strand:- start:605 stop:916 length:312 start_codon:yes stop_codon:yes gene_type:complete
MKKLNEKIVCVDGFSMSVQAGAGSYCEPRVNDAQKYTEVEVGFPSDYESLLAPYAEDKEDYTGTVYGWVPADIIVTVCAKHGGVVTGELPNGVHYLEANNESR